MRNGWDVRALMEVVDRLVGRDLDGLERRPTYYPQRVVSPERLRQISQAALELVKVATGPEPSMLRERKPPQRARIAGRDNRHAKAK